MEEQRTGDASGIALRAVWSTMRFRLPGAGLLVLFCGTLRAQTVVIDTLRAVQPWGRQMAYTFPSVRLPNDPEVGERINRSLSIAFLGVDPNTAQGEPLSALWGDPEPSGMPRINNLHWSCAWTAPGVLTIRMTGEACGANCEGFDSHYTYDLRSGAYLDLDALFSDSGRVVAEDSITRRWERRLAQRIVELKAEQVALGLNGDVTTYQDEAIAMFEDCLGMYAQRGAPIADFFPTPDGLRFITARCSHHVDQEMDDLFPLAIDLSRAELSGLLRPAAREALGW